MFVVKEMVRRVNSKLNIRLCLQTLEMFELFILRNEDFTLYVSAMAVFLKKYDAVMLLYTFFYIGTGQKRGRGGRGCDLGFKAGLTTF